MPNITQELVDYIWKLNEKDIPERVYQKARECILDYTGVTFAGAYCTQKSFEEYYHHFFEETGVPVIGTGKKASFSNAAFINAFHAHVMELDDGHRHGMIHLGANIISALLAVSQKESLEGTDTLKGIILGYEAAVRLALAVQPNHKLLGFHTSGTCGTVGTAIGVGIALGLKKDRLQTVISAAITSAAGLLEIQEDSSELKPYNLAHAAQTGIMAAYIGLTNLYGPDDIIGGERGFFNLFSRQYDAELMIKDTDYYEIEKIYVKPYSACRHCHSAIEAVMNIKSKYEISTSDVESITVNTYKLAVKGHDHKVVRGAASAKLSIPYSIAATFVTGRCDESIYSRQMLENAEILAITNKITVKVNEDYTKESPHKRIAEVVIKKKDGTSYAERVDYAKGDPENPMSYEEIRAKYQGLMRLSDKQNVADRIADCIFHFEEKYEELYRLLQA
ncbi:MAG: MmgE/PrpD family protein [Lachnospiraceae bacterium]